MNRTVVISETTYTGLQSSLDTYTDAGYKVVGYQIIQPVLLSMQCASADGTHTTKVAAAVHCVIMSL